MALGSNIPESRTLAWWLLTMGLGSTGRKNLMDQGPEQRLQQLLVVGRSGDVQVGTPAV